MNMKLHLKNLVDQVIQDDDYNPILDTDSYKLSHFKQYPKDADGYFGYVESRGGEYAETVFFGLQYFLKKIYMT